MFYMQDLRDWWSMVRHWNEYAEITDDDPDEVVSELYRVIQAARNNPEALTRVTPGMFDERVEDIEEWVEDGLGGYLDRHDIRAGKDVRRFFDQFRVAMRFVRGEEPPSPGSTVPEEITAALGNANAQLEEIDGIDLMPEEVVCIRGSDPSEVKEGMNDISRDRPSSAAGISGIGAVSEEELIGCMLFSEDDS